MRMLRLAGYLVAQYLMNSDRVDGFTIDLLPKLASRVSSCPPDKTRYIWLLPEETILFCHFLQPPVSTITLTLSPMVAFVISTRSLVAMPYFDSRSVPHIYTMMVTVSCPFPRALNLFSLALPVLGGVGSGVGIGVGVGVGVGVGSGVFWEGVGVGSEVTEGVCMNIPRMTLNKAITATTIRTILRVFLGSLLKSAASPKRASGDTPLLPEPARSDEFPDEGRCPSEEPGLPPDPTGPVPEDPPT